MENSIQHFDDAKVCINFKFVNFFFFLTSELYINVIINFTSGIYKSDLSRSDLLRKDLLRRDLLRKELLRMDLLRKGWVGFVVK